MDNKHEKILKEKNKKDLCTVCIGVAARLLSGGETIHSLFQFHVI